jgi:membrane protein
MKVREIIDLFKETFKEWWDDDPTDMGAALAYYALFSLAPLAIIAVAVAGWLFGAEAAEGELARRLHTTVGPTFAKAIEELIGYVHRYGSSAWATVIGVVVILLGSLGLFSQLQQSLNAIWGVDATSGSGWWNALRKRLWQFVMVGVVALLLLVSLVATTVVQTIGTEAHVAELTHGAVGWRILNWAISFVLIVILFAVLFKVLPDVEISWKDVWIGSLLTTVLFLIGNFVIGMYLTQTGTASAYGAAGSIVIVLLWAYYSSQVLLFGAEFTQVYANRYGAPAIAAGAEPHLATSFHCKRLAARSIH